MQVRQPRELQVWQSLAQARHEVAEVRGLVPQDLELHLQPVPPATGEAIVAMQVTQVLGPVHVAHSL